MSNLSPASFPFTIGSGVLRKNTKKTQPVNLEDIPITCGIPTHTRPLDDAGLLEKARRAEYDRRAAYDTRAELARREEHDRRMEYALNLAFGQPRNASTIEDYELQACRLEQMGKLIENLTTMITKSSRHEAAAAESIETTLVSSCSQQVLALEVTARESYEDCEDWSLHMTDEEGKALSVLIRMQEPGEFSSQQVFDRASKDMLERRHIVKICRRGTVFQHGKDPGFHRAHEGELKFRKILKICRKAAEEVQVGTPHVANLAHARREATRGAQGWAAGLQRKEKAIQKRRLRKLSRIKRAGEYWEKRSPTQETSGASNNKERRNKQIRISARVIRTSDPKLRIKIIFSGHRLDNRGVMSLKIYSTRREKMKLSTLVTKRANKKGQYIRSNTRRIKDNNEQKDWWKTLSNSNRNWKPETGKGKA